MGSGTFDTLNPYTLKGTSPIATGNFYQSGISELNEPLMVGSGIYDPSGDDPFSAYGLIAESLELPDDRSCVVFNRRPDARSHGRRSITAHDAAFSSPLQREQDHPQRPAILQDVTRADLLRPHRLRFIFKQADNPLLILRLGGFPVLPEHYQRD